MPAESQTGQQTQVQPGQTQAQMVFARENAEIKDIIRAVMEEERKVSHMRRRSDIHTRLYDHIRRIIK